MLYYPRKAVNTIKAIIYARYSSDNQTENSIDGQLRECKAYAEREGTTVLTTYIDRALSAKTDNRPQFQQMIKDSAHYKNILKKNGVKVISATERISDTPEGILLESMLEGYAEFYSAELAEKVKRGLKENALKCKFNGSNIPLGYAVNDDRQFVVNSLTAPIVSEIFTEYASGTTKKVIVENLTNKGIIGVTGVKMSINTITNMLENRRYLGEYRYGDVVVENAFEPIVTPEIFNAVQARMEKNKRSPARFKADELYVLSGKLFCGKCGSQMVADSGRSKGGKVFRYYKCYNNKTKRICDKKAVQKVWLEDIVLDETIEMLHDEPLINRIVNGVFDLQAQENTELPLLKRNLAETEKSIENILNAIQQGVLTSSTKERLEKLEQAKETLETEIMKAELKRPHFTKEQIRFWIDRFKHTDLQDQAGRQSLIDTFVNSVFSYDDEYVLMFNYKDGEKTLKLKDVEQKRTCSNLNNVTPPTARLTGFSVSLVFSLGTRFLPLGTFCFSKIRHI